MKKVTVTVVRIYLMEDSKLLNKILDYLKQDAKIPGVSVFRAIEGFGSTGEHASGLMDLSLSLPLAVEFFADPEKIEPALIHLSTVIKPDHIICWPAQALES